MDISLLPYHSLNDFHGSKKALFRKAKLKLLALITNYISFINIFEKPITNEPHD